MYLMYYLDNTGTRVYTMAKVILFLAAEESKCCSQISRIPVVFLIRIHPSSSNEIIIKKFTVSAKKKEFTKGIMTMN
jgi:hypothetical protein